MKAVAAKLLKRFCLHNCRRGVEALVTQRVSGILGAGKEITTCAKLNRL